MNLGVDFGSTYSAFATYNPETRQVELCRTAYGESEAIPSLACVNNRNQILTGHIARDYLRNKDPGARSFTAFKMLLTENDERLLQERDYSQTYSPQVLTGQFLQDQIRRVLDDRVRRQQDRDVERLVICVPELWGNKRSVEKGKLDGRVVLRDICTALLPKAQVQVVSEPVAASACFVHLHPHCRGHILVIDYGGGTLDLTVTEVRSSGDTVEIKELFDSGLGENHPGRVGSAGIAYMEAVVRLALCSCEQMPEQIPYDVEFRRAVQSLEADLMGQVSFSAGEEHYAESDDPQRLFFAVSDCEDDISRLIYNHEVFTQISYQGQWVDISYAHLYQAYLDTIQQGLQTCLEEICQYMDRKGIDYRNSHTPNFHVVLVGGFSKFLFVQKQVQRYFGYSQVGDHRFDCDLGERREYAVAIGAALLAGQAIHIRQTAAFSIGIRTYRNDGSCVDNYAIRYRQEYEPGQPYWICNPDGQPKHILNASGNVRNFLFGYDESNASNNNLVIRAFWQQRIVESCQQLGGQTPSLLQNIGFSLDESGIVSLILQDCESGRQVWIELSSTREMFEITEQE